MPLGRHIQSKDTARQLLLEIWGRRGELWAPSVEPEEIFPLDVPLIIQNVLGVNVEEPEEILNGEAGVEIAGFIDRKQNKIVLAQRFKIQWRRFTAAHEVAHWLLHPKLIYLRERPLTGAERANYQRSETESEADAFAAELLMPTKLVNKIFFRDFHSPIDGRKPDDDLAFWFSEASPTKIAPSDLAGRGVQFRALGIAQADTWRGTAILPLTDQFGVSPTAMSIRLMELGLVR